MTGNPTHAPAPRRPRRLPRVVSALIADFALGAGLGALFLAALAAIDPGGIATLVFALPPFLALAVVAGGITPFAMCFAATGLDYRSSDGDGAGRPGGGRAGIASQAGKLVFARSRRPSRRSRS